MSERSIDLLRTADSQIVNLLDLVSGSDETILRRRCPGRERLGDGTVLACAQHTADTYLRIADFLRGRRATQNHVCLGHGPAPGIAGVRAELSSARSALRVLAELTEEQLDSVPPADGTRFCDGRRTLEQVLRSMLKHQGHQVDVLVGAVAP